MYHKYGRRLLQRNVFVAGALLILACLPGIAVRSAFAEDNDPPRIYLPLIINSPLIQLDAPIWAHAGEPAQHEVVLFRRLFDLATPLDATELEIFADTRYELWVDGVWQGRGPARFSETLREYDVHQLGTLAPGRHLVAVLVQWAPNERRSESTAPMLVAHIKGKFENEWTTLAQTSSDWKASLSNAWRADAQLVETTNRLIGPTELLDFRLLPAGWNQLGFDDQNWPQAFTRSDGPQAQHPVKYAPRSILPLENAPIPVGVQDAGLLSAGFLVGELVPPIADPYVLQFSISQPIDLIVETTSFGEPGSDRFRIDGQNLIWQAAGPARPDVYRSISLINAGSHRLRISEIPFEGTTFAISAPGASFSNFPFQQGRHAGRRTLLAELHSAPAVVQAVETSNGWTLGFDNLPAYLVLDLGRTVHGRVVADVSGAVGAVVDIGWDERLRTDVYRPLPYPGSLYPQWNQVDSWVLDGGSRRLTTIDARAGRYILIAVWGSGPVQIANLRVFEERYPLVQVGEFQSSDPLLDRIWQVGVDTLRPNMTDAYTDTPWRERGQWWGDAYVEDRVSRIAFGDTALIRRGLVFMANAMVRDPSPGMAPNNNGLHMLDYSMLWVHTLSTELNETQDADFASRLYPQVRQLMDHLQNYENPESRLLDLPRGHWSGTAYIEMFGYESRSGQSAALNALYVQTLNEAARIADGVGDPSQATIWRGHATEIQTSLNALLYQPLEGQYLSSMYNGAPVPATIHAQAWPLAYDLAPDGEATRVADGMLSMLSGQPASSNLGIYGMNWLLDALGKAGKIDEALQVIRLYYGYLLDAGATTWWEGFYAESRPDASYSHGWGGAPTWFLTTYVLGAQRLGPDAWQVAPSFSGVDYASGILPLQNGALEVMWERVSCGEIRLRIQATSSSSGRVIVPKLHPDLSLVVNGELVWQNSAPLVDRVAASATHITLDLEGGLYQVEGRYPCTP